MLLRRPAPLLLALACSTALTACGKKEQAPPQGGPVPVGVVVLQPQDAPIVTELPGRISSAMMSEVRPQASGVIEARLFTEGAYVKAGQVLYRIDPRPARASLASAQAALARAKATAASARLRAARYKELVAINAVSRQDYEDAQAAFAQAQADEQSAAAAVQTANINLGYSEIRAPISGRIGRSAVTPGALVTASQATPLATIQQLDPVYVDLTQSSADLLKLRQAMSAGKVASGSTKVDLKLEDGSTYPISGRLAFSEVTVDPSTGSVTLRASFPNPNGLLLPGMYVRAVLDQGVNKNAILAPQQGVARDPKGDATAMVVGAANKAEPRSLTVGRAVGDKWLVTSGLKAGDKLIVDGLQKVKPGAPVQPVAPGQPTPQPQGAMAKGK